jgi:hypothetical protein
MDDYVAPGAPRLLKLPLVGVSLGEQVAGKGAVDRLGSLFGEGVAPPDFVERCGGAAPLPRLWPLCCAVTRWGITPTHTAK